MTDPADMRLNICSLMFRCQMAMDEILEELYCLHDHLPSIPLAQTWYYRHLDLVYAEQDDWSVIETLDLPARSSECSQYQVILNEWLG